MQGEKRMNTAMRAARTMMMLIAAACICLLCSCELSAPKVQGTTRALVIGLDYSCYSDLADSQLQGAVTDALDMTAALRAMGAEVQTFIQSSDASCLPEGNQEPTKANVLAAIESIAQIAQSQDCLVVYFSGHGLSSTLQDSAAVKGLCYSKALVFKASIGFEEGFYFLLEGESYKYTDASILLSKSEFTSAVERVRGATVALVDTCASGSLAEAGGAIVSSDNASLSTKQLLIAMGEEASTMNVLASSRADQVSYEVRTAEESYGVFTRAILEGLGYDRASGTVALSSLTLNQLAGFVTDLNVQNARLSGSPVDVTIF
jgi:hypothetical protein